MADKKMTNGIAMSAQRLRMTRAQWKQDEEPSICGPDHIRVRSSLKQNNCPCILTDLTKPNNSEEQCIL